MIQNFFLGFTSGCLIGFILHRFLKKPLSNNFKDQINDMCDMKTVNSNLTEEEEPVEMVLCINDDLKMTKGKLMAQCAHAAVGVYESFFKTSKSTFDTWEKQGKHVSMFKVADGKALKSLNRVAEDYNLLTCLVRDAGRTQIPSGSITVLAIGPALKSDLECLTRDLISFS